MDHADRIRHIIKSVLFFVGRFFWSREPPKVRLFYKVKRSVKTGMRRIVAGLVNWVLLKILCNSNIGSQMFVSKRGREESV